MPINHIQMQETCTARHASRKQWWRTRRSHQALVPSDPQDTRPEQSFYPSGYLNSTIEILLFIFPKRYEIQKGLFILRHKKMGFWSWPLIDNLICNQASPVVPAIGTTKYLNIYKTRSNKAGYAIVSLFSVRVIIFQKQLI